LLNPLAGAGMIVGARQRTNDGPSKEWPTRDCFDASVASGFTDGALKWPIYSASIACLSPKIGSEPDWSDM
jgi:hypothetical protein